jgi:quercetin dioxygenase-like cupin family protein
MIDFDQIPEQKIPNMKGGKGVARCRMYTDGMNKILKATLDPGCSIGYHAHTDGAEVCYILEGEATCVLDGQEEIVEAGEVHYCPKGSSHSMENKTTQPLVVMNVVTKQ